MKKNYTVDCPIRKTLEILGGKWKLLIIFQFRADQPVRYGELKKKIPDISEKMLIQELKVLVENGLLLKHSYPEIPPRVEYTITKRGKEVLPIIDTLAEFGMQYVKTV
ncbi:winged helix-turn-helix transcriptional regulator [Desertivirga brevis]|uniref:winged helix-turn-helix transcriptional regulator n=1 Tax=Desertivirga brevis TaxID=2810310 RepID=UPI001A96EF09|nr:helix-turn-helix domain-containing protein [Pedobacter sp. SYSU D00873]